MRALRPQHDLAGPTSVPDVTRALRRFVHRTRFDGVLRTLPEGAVDFWRGAIDTEKASVLTTEEPSCAGGTREGHVPLPDVLIGSSTS